MKNQAWDVYLKNMLIDTVWFDQDMSQEAVKESLVNHDHYPPSIIVRKGE